MTDTLRAEIFVPTPEIVSTVVDHCSEHRPWFSDFIWDAPNRREITTAHIANLYTEMQRGEGYIWSIWRGATLVGIINVGNIEYRTNANCHFIFFDKKLADKYDLCISLLAWCFQKLDLHRLSAEIPTYAVQLVKFARRLGFRYEAEKRIPYTPKTDYIHKGAEKEVESATTLGAYVGSRKHQAVLYEGRWHDVLLLSLLREEFELERPKTPTP